MALENRKLAIVVSQASNAKAGPMPLEDIPAWIQDDMEQAYAQCKANPAARLQAVFDSVEDAKLYQRMGTSYCQNRPNGQIRFRKSPTRNQPDHIIDFRVTDLLTERERETEDIRTAVKAVKAAAAPAPIAAPVGATPVTVAKKAPGRPAKVR